MLAALISLFFAFPTYERFSDLDRLEVWQVFLDQAGAPFDPFWTEDLVPGSHSSKIPLRPVPGVIGWVFNLGISGFLALYAIASLVVIASSALIVERLTGDRVKSALIAVAVACVYAGGSGFVEVRGFRDILPIAFLMTALLIRSPVLVGVLIFAAAGSDERSIVVAFLVVLFHSLGRRQTLMRAAFAPALGIMAYVALRTYMVVGLGFHADTGEIGLPVLIDQRGYFALAPATSVEMILPMVLLGVWRSFSRGSRLTAWLFAGTVIAVVLIGLSVIDLTRSMSYLLPALFVAVAVDPKMVTRSRAWLIALACAVIPNYWLIGGQVRWAESLPVQLARFAGFG